MKAVLLCLTCCFTLASMSALGQEYLPYYNPDKGFKPAQTNLTEVFLQLAGSLEHHGSPEFYLRHMQKEHIRVARKFESKFKKPLKTCWPAHMTDQYIDKLIKNWGLLAPRLELATFAKDAGRCTREGIRGTRNTGTIVIEVFNQHQRRIADQMSQKGAQTVGFDQLRTKLTTTLEYDKEKIDMTGYDASRRDAVSYALIFEGIQDRLHARIDGILSPTNSAQVKEMVNSMLLDLGYMAHAELELGIVNWSLDG